MAVVIAQGTKPAFAYENIVVDATVGGVALTSTCYKTFTESLNRGVVTAKQAMISVETQSIRALWVPSTVAVPLDSTTGHLFAAGDIIWLESGSQIRDFRAVRVGGASANIKVSYYGE